jgi:hypothetical protein
VKNGKPKKPARVYADRLAKRRPLFKRWADKHDSDVVIVIGLTEDGRVVDWEGADFGTGAPVNWHDMLRSASDGAKKFALAEAATGDIGDQVEASVQKIGDAVVDAAFKKLGSLFGARSG